MPPGRGAEGGGGRGGGGQVGRGRGGASGGQLELKTPFPPPGGTSGGQSWN